MLFLGDSILGWNEKSCRSIPAYTSEITQLPYASAAVNGARVLSAEAPITEQHLDGDWQLVVIAGGANDLNASCECGECDAVLNQLATTDGQRGAMPKLVDAWADQGIDVLLIGYYPVPDAAWYGFDRCHEVITELDRRYATIAETRENVTFFDLGDQVTPEGPNGIYAFDHAHPSPKGAQLAAEGLANAILTRKTN